VSQRANRARPPAFGSLAFEDIPEPDFADVVVVSIPASARDIVGDPAWWARQIFSIRTMPRWIAGLLGIRQILVRLIGVRPSPVSVFDVDKVEGDEALISADDSHLDFRVAVGIDPESRLLRVTTTVRLHGWRGRLYFLPVGVLHNPVTRSMTRRAVRDFLKGS
jgi:hypothetical protein